MTALQKLAEAVQRRQLIIVTGTGVTSSLTANAATSSWLGLLEHGVVHVEDVDPRRGRLMRDKLELFLDDPRVDDLLSLASDIRTELKRAVHDRYGRWLSATVGELRPSQSAVADALGSLGAPLFTTNYDDVLEQALGRGSATWKEPAMMREIAMHNSTAVGHLHGLWNDPDSVIFNDVDYHRIVNNSPAQAIQDAAFGMRHFLFVGFGSGLDDPNFEPLVKRFADVHQTAAFSHFRLCRTDEVRPGSDLDVIADVAYGQHHDNLAGFLTSLAPESISVQHVDRRVKGQERLLRQVRENSTLWREKEVLDEKRFEELVVPPIFLPEPHDQYATNTVIEAESKQIKPVDMGEIVSKGKVLIIAGGESSGVSTALSWAVNEAVRVRPGTHGVLLRKAFGSGPHPITKDVQNIYADWGVPKSEGQEQLVLAVDNLLFESSSRFDRTIADIAQNAAEFKVLGVSQSDTVEVAKALAEEGIDDVDVVYLGRFSDAEAGEIARRVAPGRETRFVTTVMVIIRDKHLPRTPFTITLLMELLNSGKTLKNQDSEMSVLDEYLNLLLFGDFPRVTSSPRMSLRNKRVVIEYLARKLVEAREDKAPYGEVAGWVAELFDEVGWSYEVDVVLEDLKQRRVLSTGPGNTIRFQRSIYLELLAGIAAKGNEEFKKLIFSSPLELASIVRMYAAMARSDTDVLDVVERELDRISVQRPTGSILSSVRKRDAPESLLREPVPLEADDQPAPLEDVVDRAPEQTVYYDRSDDSDRPTFLAARIEDLPPARVAMLVVDLASRVLRDSDEIRDQAHKQRYLGRLLEAWVMFLELYQAELTALPKLDEAVRPIFDKLDLPDKEFVPFMHSLLRVVPSYITYSGLSYCLSSPTLDRLLTQFSAESVPLGEWAALLRTLTLYSGGSIAWVDSLDELSETAVRSWFSASFLAGLARYAYVTDDRLHEEQRAKIRQYLRRVIGARYSFSSVSQRNSAMNNFEADLRSARLREERRPRRSLRVIH
ncbi:SIR2 family protein [Frigoribacterium endophyticum]|uniref:SIR2 family protein n=1 Tax=Frigoribacterium endophyticum TaxID=1522176 RepID=UPI00141DAAB6|nr:SIR2 family protein [Frigoribacterium endophyticum]NII52079.1 hypothetical protein [Frigoribacterium endophyticum]